MLQRTISRFAVTAGSLALLWLVLSEGDPSSWIFGAPTVLLGAALAGGLPAPPPGRLAPAAIPGFLIVFLWGSLGGAFDIAWRALSPRPRLAPGFLDHVLRLPPGPARTLFLNVLTLLPGTLSVGISGDRVTIHVVDLGQPHAAMLQRLEGRVARLWGQPPAGEG